MKSLLWVALGGALGSMGRFLISRWLPSSAFPWGTFAVNIAGCFLIGIFWAMSLKNTAITENFRLFLITGICGGFTTFSTFALENLSLLRDGKFSLFLMYSLGSLVLGIFAVFLAVRLLGNN